MKVEFVHENPEVLIVIPKRMAQLVRSVIGQTIDCDLPKPDQKEFDDLFEALDKLVGEGPYSSSPHHNGIKVSKS